MFIISFPKCSDTQYIGSPMFYMLTDLYKIEKICYVDITLVMIEMVCCFESIRVTRSCNSQMILSFEGLCADHAHILPFVAVRQLVLCERTRVIKDFPADRTINALLGDRPCDLRRSALSSWLVRRSHRCHGNTPGLC